MTISDHPNHPTGDLLGYIMWVGIGLAFAGAGWLILAIVAFIAGVMAPVYVQ